MMRSRRGVLGLAAGAAALSTVGRAGAQAYPSRPVRWLVGFAPGGGNDLIARLMGQFLSERLGQQFVVENKPGAGTNLATEAVVTAAPDGYTLLQAGLPNASNAALFRKLSFDFIRDIAPIVGILRVANVMVVHPSVPARTLAEFVAYAKTAPGRISCGSAGVGSATHLSVALFNFLAGVDLLHVPYRGTGPALAALLAGEVQVQFPPVAAALDHIRSGAVRALAVTSAARSRALPDVPPVGETVPGYEMTVWYGMGAPRGTPTAVIDTLNRAVNAGLADPRLKTRFEELDGAEIGGTPDDFARLIAEETEKWTKVVRAAGITLD